ncbi:hypothetical protein WJX72_011533 [[Myrmecia] bisecta]|uniref:Hemoglobin n=1 Tax=[Myrmecia] bisecta TaxID=41462 RepID=A0AAW1Q6K8_9CHLO
MESKQTAPLPAKPAGPSPRKEAGIKTCIFDKLGGRHVIATAVNIFYAKLITDFRIANFFEGVDMHKLKLKQVFFMQYAFGGPNEYTGKELAEAHAHLVRDKGLLPMHFDIVLEHFMHTLQELNVAQEVLEEAVATVASTKSVIFPPHLVAAARQHGSDSDFDDFEEPDGLEVARTEMTENLVAIQE